MMTTTDDERDTQSDDNSSDDLSGKVIIAYGNQVPVYTTQ